MPLRGTELLLYSMIMGDSILSRPIQALSFLFSGINFNKDFGQHILKNPLVVDSMIEKVR